MKKFFYIPVAMMMALAIGSCKDYDDSANPYEHFATITVDSTSVVFQAAPSTGFITVNAQNGITNVTSSADWCTATVSGNTVNLAVTQNDNLEGRSSQITIWSGSDSTHVTVQQLGFVFQLETGTADNSIVTNDDAQSLPFYMKHNTEIAVSTSDDWLAPVVDGDSLRISLAENATGNPRQGFVYYSSGTMRDSISVTQFEADKDLVGNYNLWYTTSSSSDPESSYPMTLSRDDDGTYALHFTSGSYSRYGFRIPVELGTDEPTITVLNLDSIGLYTDRNVEYQVRLLILSTSNGSSTRRSDDTTYRGVGYWSVDDNGYNTWDFDVSAKYGSSYYFFGLRLALSTDGTYDGISLTLRNLYWAYLEKDNGSGAKPVLGPRRMRTGR